MNENFTANSFDNGDNSQTTEQSEYEYLITRLQEIRSTISILKKKVSR